MTIITLTSDQGSSAPSTGQMYGSIWSVAPEATLVDLAHEIPPHNLLSAQTVLENAISYFPDGTIHLAVVTADAGEEPRPIAAQMGPMLFTGPDNGLITPLLERAEANRWEIAVVHINRQEYWPEDLPLPMRYAVLAGHLARGVPLTALGERTNDPQRAPVPAPEMIDNGWRGQVIHIDHFGNLVANIKRAHLEGMGALQVLVAGQEIQGLSKTFGDGQPGQVIALIDSSNRLSISIVNGDAAQTLSMRPGDAVEVISRTEP